MLFDITPFPLPPAFTVMVAMQIAFDLNIWITIAVGVIGSIIGRWVLSLYIPHVSDKLFNHAKNEDVQYLGKKMEEKGWKGPAAVLIYSLLPLPTTPLFIAGGMARISPFYIIPPFIIGKVISDTAAVLTGNYAADNVQDMIHGLVSWKSIVGLTLGLLFIFLLVFIDWRTLIQKKKFTLKFKILK